MLSLPSSVKICLVVEACDLRKSFCGLQGLVRDSFGLDPGNGSLYLFTNKRHNRLKILYWDGSGFWVMSKRLEQGGFSWPRGVSEQEGLLHLNRRALALLLDGVELRNGHKKAWFEA